MEEYTVLINPPEYHRPDYPQCYKDLLARLEHHPRLSNAEKNLMDLLYMAPHLLSNKDHQALQRAAVIADSHNPILGDRNA